MTSLSKQDEATLELIFKGTSAATAPIPFPLDLPPPPVLDSTVLGSILNWARLYQQKGTFSNSIHGMSKEEMERRERVYQEHAELIRRESARPSTKQSIEALTVLLRDQAPDSPFLYQDRYERFFIFTKFLYLWVFFHH